MDGSVFEDDISSDGDSVHNEDESSELSWGSRPVSAWLAVREFFHAAVRACLRKSKYVSEGTSTDEWADQLAQMSEYDKDVLLEIEDLVDPRKLRNKRAVGDAELEPPFESVPDDTPLLTHKLRREELSKRSKVSYKQMVVLLSPYSKYKTDFLQKMNDRIKNTPIPKPRYIPEDVMLKVFFLKPLNKPPPEQLRRSGKLAAIDYIFLVLGRQRLTELRDKILCVSDTSPVGDFSEDSDKRPNLLRKELFPGGYFYIGNTFYNDMRSPGATDLSKEVMKWSLRHQDEMGPFQTAKMEETTFLDLQLRLGQLYVYRHQGNCEHMMLFSDIRALTYLDSHDIRDYPVSICRAPRKRIYCYTCKNTVASWIVTNGDRMPAPVVHFCDDCFRRTNYDPDGKKVGTFSAAPFVDRSTLYLS